MANKEHVLAGHEELAKMVVLNAVQDYKSALKRVKKEPNDAYAKHTIFECELFFRGEWFTALTELNGERIIKQGKDTI